MPGNMLAVPVCAFLTGDVAQNTIQALFEISSSENMEQSDLAWLPRIPMSQFPVSLTFWQPGKGPLGLSNRS